MANLEKYKDHFPFICAAGVANKINYGAADCLKQYNLVDGAQALKADYHVPDKEYKSAKLPKVSARLRNPGIYSEIRELLSPSPSTRYLQLINDLKETTYASYWNKKLGQTRDSTPAFPAGMNIEEITFGDPYHYELSVKDIIQPPKTPYQVLWESQINHDAYKKVYDSYNPGERIERGYEPPFDPSKAFGKQSGYDKRGLKAKCCLKWHDTTPVIIVNKVQGNFMREKHHELGKGHKSNQILKKLPKDHAFGAPYQREMYGVEDLLKDPDTPISITARDIRVWLVSFHRLRMTMETMISPTFDYDVLYNELKVYDKDGSGWITFDNLLQVFKCNEIVFNINNVKNLMEYVGIVSKDKVNYRKVLDALRGDLNLKKIHIPGKNKHFETTYQEACRDLILPDDNICLRKAGIPTRIIDERKPASAYSEKYLQLSDFTDVKACLQPSLLTQYSLSHRDLLCARDQDFLKSLFRKIGYELSDEHFAKIWKIGTERDGSDRVCVQTFRELMNEYFPLQRKLNVDGVPYSKGI